MSSQLCLAASTVVARAQVDRLTSLAPYHLPSPYVLALFNLLPCSYGVARHECVKRRIPPTKLNMMAQYILRVRRNLHVILCMSPVGEAFRARLRAYPSLVNCTTIDNFSDWPEEALRSVGASLLSDAAKELGLTSHLTSVVEFFQAAHLAVAEASTRFEGEMRRHNYVTPTSFLELLSTFKSVLASKQAEVGTLRSRLQTGLDKITSTEAVVASLQAELVAMQPVLEQTQAEVAAMIVQLTADKASAAETKAIVEREDAEVQRKAAETKAIAGEHTSGRLKRSSHINRHSHSCFVHVHCSSTFFHSHSFAALQTTPKRTWTKPCLPWRRLWPALTSSKRATWTRSRQ